jgi:hypothetical protein
MVCGVLRCVQCGNILSIVFSIGGIITSARSLRSWNKGREMRGGGEEREDDLLTKIYGAFVRQSGRGLESSRIGNPWGGWDLEQWHLLQLI